MAANRLKTIFVIVLLMLGAGRLSAQEEATLLGLLHKLRAAEDEKAD